MYVWCETALILDSAIVMCELPKHTTLTTCVDYRLYHVAEILDYGKRILQHCL